MLLNVGIDPTAGAELADGLKGPGPSLIRYLRERCMLVVESDAAAGELQRAFQHTVSTEVAEAVMQLLQHRRVRSSPVATPVALKDLESLDEIESWRGFADLLLLAQWRLEYLDPQATPADPEIATLREAMNSDAVARVNDEWDRPVRSGESREDVWRQRFQPFARHSDNAYVIDGYLAAELARRLKAPGKVKSGGEWFLTRLAGTRVKRVHIATSSRPVLSDGRSVEEVHHLISTWFNSLGSGTELRLRIVDGNFDHGRRIAFAGFAGFDIHKGLATFDGSRITEIMGMNASRALADEVVREFARITASR
jgi:hypothetical protein